MLIRLLCLGAVAATAGCATITRGSNDVLVVNSTPGAAQAAWPALAAVARGVALSRDLASEPPNVLHPTELAERCRPLADLGVEVVACSHSAPESGASLLQ